MKNSQQGFIGIAIIIILAATIGGGIYYKEKVNPDFLSRKDDSGERLPIKEIDKKTVDLKADVVASPAATVSSKNDIKITPPSIPSTSVSVNTKANVTAPIPVAASSDLKMCTDAKCFTDAINICAPAKFTQSSAGELLGSKINVNFAYETKPNTKNCDLKLTVNSYSIAPSEGLLSNGETFEDQNGKTVRFDEYYKDLNIKSQTTIGKSMICTLADSELKKTFIEIILNKEGYKFILGDDSCKGELVTTMVNNSK